MNSLLEKIIGMDVMSDQVIATDLLIAAKSGVRNISIALTEVTSPVVRTALRGQLEEAIESYEKISNYMITKGYYHPYDIKEQIQVDLKTSDTALKLV